MNTDIVLRQSEPADKTAKRTLLLASLDMFPLASKLSARTSEAKSQIDAKLFKNSVDELLQSIGNKNIPIAMLHELPRWAAENAETK